MQHSRMGISKLGAIVLVVEDRVVILASSVLCPNIDNETSITGQVPNLQADLCR